MTDYSKLFTSTDPAVLRKDELFWDTVVRSYLRVYRETKVGSCDDNATKAIACARLAAVGLGMAEHFAIGVTSLMDTDNPNSTNITAVHEVLDKIVTMCKKHRDRLDAKVAKAEN